MEGTELNLWLHDKKKISVREFSLKTKISINTIYKWTCGEGKPGGLAKAMIQKVYPDCPVLFQ